MDEFYRNGGPQAAIGCWGSDACLNMGPMSRSLHD